MHSKFRQWLILVSIVLLGAGSVQGQANLERLQAFIELKLAAEDRLLARSHVTRQTRPQRRDSKQLIYKIHHTRHSDQQIVYREL